MFPLKNLALKGLNCIWKHCLGIIQRTYYSILHDRRHCWLAPWNLHVPNKSKHVWWACSKFSWDYAIKFISHELSPMTQTNITSWSCAFSCLTKILLRVHTDHSLYHKRFLATHSWTFQFESNHCSGYQLLTHWDRKRWPPLWQKTLSNTNSSMKIFQFR